MNATQEQIGGSHYKDMPIQPVEFIHRNGIPYIEGNVIKYVARWRKKGGVEDLKKARHFIDMLIEMEGTQGAEGTAKPEPLPWPERYEVGMKFRRKDGEVAKCVWHGDEFAYISAKEGWHYSAQDGQHYYVWSYRQGSRATNRADEFPQSELVEYLGKDTN